MALTEQEFQSEKLYLKDTLSLIYLQLEEYKEKMEQLAQDMDDTIKYVWENISSMDSAEKSFFNQSLSVNNNIGNIKSNRYKILKKMYDSPYFARVDFKYQNDELLNIYIGISNLTDKHNHNVVFDWRSPISSLFYEYELGEASYRAPASTISGQINLKRQYKIEDQKLLYAFDSSKNITDEILQQALSESTEDKMKNIVMTIQKEQNPIIRYAGADHLIVEGPAGSGKTSVALHRNAYLLYLYKENLRPEEILIFSPNSIFSDYISDVLPSLGEKNVVCTEFSEYAEKVLDKYKNIEDYSTFIERINNLESYEEQDLIKTKFSYEFIQIIDKFLEEYINNFDIPEIKVTSQFSLAKSVGHDMFINQYKNYPLFNRLNKLLEYTVMKFSHAVACKINEEKVINKLKENYFLLDTKDIIMSFLNSSEVAKSLKKENPDLNIDYFVSSTLKNLEGNILTFEDAILVLYFEDKLKGSIVDKRIKYVVIDEAQDYSYMQYLILKNIFKNAIFTILGDSNQTLNPYFKYVSLADLITVFGSNAKILPLNTSYRNSFEITDFCNNILDLENVNPINRHSFEPSVFVDESADNRVAKLVSTIKENQLLGYTKMSLLLIIKMMLKS